MKSVDYPALSDEDLFELVKRHNDKVAFDVLYKRYDRRLFSYCLRAMEDRDEAKDVYQQAIMNIYAKRDTFKGGSFVAWLMTIVRNQCLMAKRSKKYTRDVDEMQNVLVASDSVGATDHGLNEAVHKAVDSLPADFKEVVAMRYFDEFSYEQIAQTLGISMSLVKVRLYRAKKLLLEALSPYREELL